MSERQRAGEACFDAHGQQSVRVIHRWMPRDASINGALHQGELFETEVSVNGELVQSVQHFLSNRDTYARCSGGMTTIVNRTDDRLEAVLPGPSITGFSNAPKTVLTGCAAFHIAALINDSASDSQACAMDFLCDAGPQRQFLDDAALSGLRASSNGQVWYEGNQGSWKAIKTRNSAALDFVEPQHASATKTSPSYRTLHSPRRDYALVEYGAELDTDHVVIFVGGTGKYNALGQSIAQDIGYANLMDQLSLVAGVQVVAYDKYPVSRRNGWTPTFNELRNDLDDVAGYYLSQGRRVTVYGHSFGGVLALACVQRAALESLVLHAVPSITLEQTLLEQIERATSGNFNPDMAVFCRARQERIIGMLRDTGSKPAGSLLSLLGSDGETFLRSSLSIDPVSLAETQELPRTLLLYGEADMQVPIQQMRAFRSSHTSEVTYSGGHIPSDEDKYAQAVGTFLNDS